MPFGVAAVAAVLSAGCPPGEFIGARASGAVLGVRRIGAQLDPGTSARLAFGGGQPGTSPRFLTKLGA